MPPLADYCAAVRPSDAAHDCERFLSDFRMPHGPQQPENRRDCWHCFDADIDAVIGAAAFCIHQAYRRDAAAKLPSDAPWGRTLRAEKREAQRYIDGSLAMYGYRPDGDAAAPCYHQTHHHLSMCAYMLFQWHFSLDVLDLQMTAYWAPHNRYGRYAAALLHSDGQPMPTIEDIVCIAFSGNSEQRHEAARMLAHKTQRPPPEPNGA